MLRNENTKLIHFVKAIKIDREILKESKEENGSSKEGWEGYEKSNKNNEQPVKILNNTTHSASEDHHCVLDVD